jgi:hypothetical protein
MVMQPLFKLTQQIHCFEKKQNDTSCQKATFLLNLDKIFFGQLTSGALLW